jgi:hypothetical protein
MDSEVMNGIVLELASTTSKYKDMQPNTAVTMVVDYLRKHRIGLFRVMGAVQYGEMVAVAKDILKRLGVPLKVKG